MASLLVIGFSRYTTLPTERHSIDYRESVTRLALKQWDILEAHEDTKHMGTLGGPRSRDYCHQAYSIDRGCGRFDFFTLRIPSIEVRTAKELIEVPYREWPACGAEVCGRKDVPESEATPTKSIRKGFYLDYGSLLEAAQIALLSIGDIYLNEIEAKAAIKHKADSTMVNKLFTGELYG